MLSGSFNSGSICGIVARASPPIFPNERTASRRTRVFSIGQRGDEHGNAGLGLRPDIADRLCRVLPNRRLGIVHLLDQVRQRGQRRRADLPQRAGGVPADFNDLVLEQADQRRHGVLGFGAQLGQGPRGGRARRPAEHLDQTRHVLRIVDAHLLDRLGGDLPHVGVFIVQRVDQGQLGLLSRGRPDGAQQLGRFPAPLRGGPVAARGAAQHLREQPSGGGPARFDRLLGLGLLHRVLADERRVPIATRPARIELLSPQSAEQRASRIQHHGQTSDDHDCQQPERPARATSVGC